jgi:16S rRNA (adenine1518-N6/adenine1519-N6)-dimethyltransferase
VGRRLGQHFLSNPAILDAIVGALEPEPDDLVVEIGPGRGTLTRRLAPRVAQVIAIEKDPLLARDLSNPTLPANVRVVQGDALERSWHDLGLPVTPHRFKIIGNIPYYITTPLIEKALTPPLPCLVVFLVQKEVAERLAAAPGSKTFGALSAGVQAIAAVERLFSVRRSAFRPPPRVDSAVVRLRPLEQPLVGEQEHPEWRRFLASLFSQRRKQLSRSLRAVTGEEKEQVDALLRGLDLDPSSRPEVLRPQELVSVFRAVTR